MKTNKIHGFDRITFWIDRPELIVTEKRIKKRCTNFNIILGQMAYNATWKSQVKIFQPSIKCLELFKDKLYSEVRTSVNYAEIACDAVSNRKGQSQYWKKKLIGEAKMMFQRQEVVHFEGTYYFGRRESKRGNVLVVYADLPSKINNAKPTTNAFPCLHLEYRVRGSIALSNHGIVSIEDLIRFDHEPFWSKNIRMYQLPNLTTLGRLLGKLSGSNNDISSTSLRKRARKWIVKFTDDEDNFVMHNALLATPKLARHLKTLPFNEWLDAMVLTESDAKL